MEPLSWLIIIVAVLILAALVWVAARFFFRLLKHIIIAVVLGAVLTLGWYYFFLYVPRDPNIGRHAYITGTEQYVGDVIGSANDEALGAVWVVKRPNGYATKYPKSRVTLKDK